MKEEQIKLVLVEPMGPLNLGSIARLCENFGINELRLVSPRCDPNDLEARKMALRGKRILQKAIHYESLLEAISDCPRVIATCGRIDHGQIPLTKPESSLRWALASPSNTPIAIVFGREDRGLTNKELLYANKVITLHSSNLYPSLNLSHSVAIVLHELHRLKIEDTNAEINETNNPAFPKQVDNFLEDSKD